MEADTVALMITIVVSVLGSSLTTIRMMTGQLNRLDDRLTGRLDQQSDQLRALTAQVHENAGELRRVSAQLKEHDRRLGDMCAELREQRAELKDQRGELAKMGEGMARIEGFLMAPEGFRPQGPDRGESGSDLEVC